MRDYELTFVIRTDVGDDQIKAAADRVQTLITGRGGQLTNVQQWGRRRLAYSIGHQREGSYFVFRFQMEPDRAIEIEHELNLDEQILRFLIVHLDQVAVEALKNPPPPMQAPERRRPAPAPAPPPAAPEAAAPEPEAAPVAVEALPVAVEAVPAAAEAGAEPAAEEAEVAPEPAAEGLEQAEPVSAEPAETTEQAEAPRPRARRTAKAQGLEGEPAS